MQLLLAIVQAEDADQLCKRLNEEGFRVTRINSAGGFLARGNVTVLLGVENERTAEVLNTIRATCHMRRSFVNALPWGPDSGHLAAASAMPLEVQVGGATVFTIPVRRFVRVRGAGAPPATDETFALDDPAEATQTMDLVLAIVQNEDAHPIAHALLTNGHRLTRMNTAGAFLRRGNVTLLVGVERTKTGQVLELIEANCKLRTEANAPASRMPMYSATIFVLPAPSIVRI